MHSIFLKVAFDLCWNERREYCSEFSILIIRRQKYYWMQNVLYFIGYSWSIKFVPRSLGKYVTAKSLRPFPFSNGEHITGHVRNSTGVHRNPDPVPRLRIYTSCIIILVYLYIIWRLFNFLSSLASINPT